MTSMSEASTFRSSVDMSVGEDALIGGVSSVTSGESTSTTRQVEW